MSWILNWKVHKTFGMLHSSSPQIVIALRKFLTIPLRQSRHIWSHHAQYLLEVILLTLIRLNLLDLQWNICMSEVLVLLWSTDWLSPRRDLLFSFSRFPMYSTELPNEIIVLWTDAVFCARVLEICWVCENYSKSAGTWNGPKFLYNRNPKYLLHHLDTLALQTSHARGPKPSNLFFFSFQNILFFLVPKLSIHENLLWITLRGYFEWTHT